MTRLTPGLLAALFSVSMVVVGLRWNTWVAGGTDSYGYVSQADLWLQGQPELPVPVADRMPWSNALATLTPLGYLPAPGRSAIVPFYAPGLPLLMAAAKLVGGHCAVFWVVPLTGGLIVALTYGLGRRIHSSAAGLAAAALVATSPAILFMVTAPMSDVPAAAFWTLAIFCVIANSIPLALVGGLAASVAILIRPNLVPIAAVLGLWLVWHDLDARPRRFTRILLLVAGVIPGCVLIAMVNNAWYGSPFKSGPGNLDHLFSLESLTANLHRYPRWFIETQTPIALAGVAALLVPARRLWKTGEARRVAALLVSVVTVVVVIHCLYAPFEDWWYLRFMLVAWPPIFVGLAVVLARLWESRRLWLRAVGLLTVVALCGHGVDVARDRGAFTNAAAERRYIAAARLVRAQTEPMSVILSMQHSGTLRYYAGRPTIRYDWIDDAWLDRAVDWLVRHGVHPYLLLEEWELTMFREKFASKSRLGGLDMKTVFIYKNPDGPAIYLYDPLTQAGILPDPIEHLPWPERCVPPAPEPTLIIRDGVPPR